MKLSLKISSRSALSNLSLLSSRFRTKRKRINSEKELRKSSEITRGRNWLKKLKKRRGRLRKKKIAIR
jgi:hypothetical protein